MAESDILSAADFAKFVGVSREAVRAKRHRNEVLALKGAKRALRFPKWQVTAAKLGVNRLTLKAWLYGVIPPQRCLVARLAGFLRRAGYL